MSSTIITLQMHYGGCFLLDPERRYDNEIFYLEKIRIDMDELHIIFFQKLSSELGLKKFINNLKGEDFVDVFVVHQISTPLIVKNPNEEQLAQPPPPLTYEEDEGQGQGNDFSFYHLQTSDESDVDVDDELYNSESLYDINIARINVEEIPSDPVGIDVGFEDINKNKRGRYEGKLGWDDLNFDSLDPGSEISEDEGDPAAFDEVEDPPARNASTKKNGYTTGTAGTGTGGSGGATTLTAFTGVTTGATTSTTSTTSTSSGGASTAATTVATCTGGSGGTTTKRPITISTTPKRETTIGGSAANIFVNFASFVQPTSQFSTQQSIIGANGSKRSSKFKRGGANPEYKRPRTTILVCYLEKMVTDRVLHSATLKSSAPTNIDLGCKPNGLRLKGGAVVTQRKL
ncbi:hypothetical protein R3W88_007279 [Solanum pinnatisectum]|uniref:Uncharacterized protein n=1 Tax=Solanum pinnatisectum TaxID=50273 RepID=A0AAV9M5F4_9SOLN|nr:hypothetical protein R3W88_007279 [Solanum pinnatisectum]